MFCIGRDGVVFLIHVIKDVALPILCAPGMAVLQLLSVSITNIVELDCLNNSRNKICGSCLATPQ